ncbi:MAG TPA: tRNA pseudouridine(38-40) synthase TruA [Symbiobacteriaceae bacterium]|nr:tRNA pseudouridine(38-40) synthase TruA [Symbiobacteriaceae bacterium]
MHTIKVTLQYDGTRYAGFQRQPNGVTVQEKLEEALRRLTGDGALKIGAAAGRTDAGVHARGQVVHFRTESRIPPDRWPYALNQQLPEDIVATRAELVPDDFHARYWAVNKRYRYTIEQGPFQSPLSRLYAFHWARELSLEAMQEVAALIAGRHDFAAFRSTGGSAKTSVRTVTVLTITQETPFVYVDVAADGFLYNMVRIIAGTLLEVGAGRRTVADVRRALETGERCFAGKTLPPHGLSLEFVTYGTGTAPRDRLVGDEDGE